MTNFDRAADFYDETRRLPPAAMAAFIAAVRDGLGSARTLLEIGVGTGRVAVPLSQAGLDVTGVDISERMLAVLQAKGSDVRTQVADATDLPFGSDQFDAGLAFYVFHLIPHWQTAVGELIRVVRPGGRIICPWQVTDHDPLSGWHDALGAAAGVPAPLDALGAADLDMLRDELARQGAGVTEGAAIPFTRTMTLGALIEGFRSGRWSRDWRIADDARAAAAAQVHRMALEQDVDLDAEHAVGAHIRPLIAVV